MVEIEISDWSDLCHESADAPNSGSTDLDFRQLNITIINKGQTLRMATT